MIGEASFQDNDLSQLMLPDGLEKIESEAFTGNPGDDHYNNRVVLWTKSGKILMVLLLKIPMLILISHYGRKVLRLIILNG